MKRLSKYTVWLLSAAFLASFTVAGRAQDATQSNQQSSSPSASSSPAEQGQSSTAASPSEQSQNPAAAPAANAGTHKSLTGCVQKNTAGAGYTLTTDSGETYHLLAANHRIDLAKHVGNKVRVTGREEQAKAAAQPAGEASAQPKFRVLHLHRISTHCSMGAAGAGSSSSSGTPY